MKRSVALLLAALMLLTLLPAAAAEQDCIDLYLEENPSTGYVWTVSSTDEAVARAENISEPEDSTQDVDDLGYGESHILRMRITGGRPGTADLRFTYCRPWESVQPLADMTLTVSVDETGALHAQVAIASDHSDGWLCEDADVLEYDPDAHAFRLTPKELADGEQRFLASEVNSARGFAFDFTTEGGVTRLSSVNFYLYALPEDGSVPFAPAFLFTTTDLEGNIVTEQIFGGQKLTILNFWESWCGPCVHEMPYLERVYQEYGGDVLILGIYATPDGEADVRAVLEDTGVTYPILHYTAEFDFLQTGYVPTTVVVNQSGAIVQEPFAGSLRYDRWAKLVEDLL